MFVSRHLLVISLPLFFSILLDPTTAFCFPSTISYSIQSQRLSQQWSSHAIDPTTTTTTTTINTRTNLLMSSSDEEMSAAVSDEVAVLNNESNSKPAMPDEGTHDELMYALGVNLARQLGDIRPLVENGQELAVLAKGLVDTVIGQFDEAEQRTLLARRGQELNKLVTERALKIQKRLEEAGYEMLEKMKQTEGVQVLDSGVVLHVLENGPEGPGQGVRPTQASTVKIHYGGTMADGTTFDSTLGGEPVTLPLAQVIKGWKEGVLKMHEGETAMIGIPPELAYGDRGSPDGRIPPGSTLFFKVQLIEVMSAGVGGGPTLLGVDGQKLKKGDSESSGLLGADGKPM